MAKRSGSIAVVNAFVHPIADDAIEGATVLVVDGVIVALGPDVVVPVGTRIIDAGNKWLLPGFIEAHAHVGIHEEANGPAGDDTNELTSPNTAGVRAIDAINIDDDGFRDALSGGITTVVVKPGSGNPIGGQTVAIKTWGGRTIDEQLVSDSVSVKSALGENPKHVYGARNVAPSTRMGTAFAIREAFVDAHNYATARDVSLGKGKDYVRDLGREALARC